MPRTRPKSKCSLTLSAFCRMGSSSMIRSTLGGATEREVRCRWAGDGTGRARDHRPHLGALLLGQVLGMAQDAKASDICRPMRPVLLHGTWQRRGRGAAWHV